MTVTDFPRDHDRSREPEELGSGSPGLPEVAAPLRPDAVPGLAWGPAPRLDLTISVVQEKPWSGELTWVKVHFTDLGALREHLATNFAPLFNERGRPYTRDSRRHRTKRERPQLFEAKFRSAVVAALIAGGDKDQLQRAWNMLQSCKAAPFEPDETIMSPLPVSTSWKPEARNPNAPEEVDDSAWSEFYDTLSPERIDRWETQLKEFLKTTESVQRTQYVPGVHLGSHVWGNRQQLLGWITAARSAGQAAEAIRMANTVQHYINLVIDGINKAQHNVRVWIEEGEGETEEGTTVAERALGLQLIELSRSWRRWGPPGSGRTS